VTADPTSTIHPSIHQPGEIAMKHLTHRTPVAAMIGLTAVAALLAGTSSTATAATTSQTCVPSTPTLNWKTPVSKATTALNQALTDLANHQYAKAESQLRVLGHQVRFAHTAATALIGRPPTDPESDEPPGIAAVDRVAGLEHSITTKLAPTFADLTRSTTVQRLGTKLNLTVACRDVMLAKVLALKPAARDDYADGLADTLPGYGKEVTALSTALAGSGLTSPARTYLENASSVVKATQAAMEKVFGGGERSPGLPR
jgi:hypothetical protein